VPVDVAVGALSHDQGGGETATLLDLKRIIPNFIHVSDGKLHDVPQTC
jgi:hypothetical protein